MNLRLTILVAASSLWAGRAYGEPGVDDVAVAKECLPTAVVRGEEELVESLGHELNLLGVSSRARASCPTATATVERGAGGVMVSLREPDGRRAARTLSDVRIAATWIDSWLHDDLGAPLLARRLLPQAPVTIARPAASSSASTAATPKPASRFLASAAYETIDVGQNSASWKGLRAGLCTHVGAACLGARVAAARNSEDTFFESDAALFSGRSVDVLAHVDVPLRVGQATVRPGVSVGAAWLQTTRTNNPDCIFVQPDEELCEDSFFEGEPKNQSTWAPKAEVELGVSLPIAKSVGLSLGGSLGVRPFGASERHIEENFPGDEPEPCLDPSDPNCDLPVFSLVSMPGEPSQFWKLFLGLQVQL